MSTGASVQHASEEHAASAKRDLHVAGRNAVTLGGSLILTWGVAFFVQFQLPRFLGPARYGSFNFADAFSAAFFTLSQLGLETYIIREIAVRPKHASDFVGGVLVVRAVVGALLLLAMYVTLRVTHRPHDVEMAVLVFGVAQLAVINNTSLAALLQASTRVKRLAVANVLSKVLWGIGLAAAIYFHASLPMLVLPLLVSELLKTMILLPAIRSAVGLEFRIDANATKLVLLASLPYFLNYGAVTIGYRMTVAALEFVTPDKREIGWYGATANLAGLAMLLSPLLSWVMMPLLARALERSEDEAFEILRRSIEGLLVLIIPFTLLIGLGADTWVRLAFGGRYAEAAPSLRLLSFDFVAVYLSMVLSSMLVLIGRNWAVTMVSLCALPVRALLIAPLAHRGRDLLGPGGAAAGAAATEIVGITVTAVLSLWLVGRRAVDGRSMSAVGKSFGVAAAVIGIDRLLRGLGEGRFALDVLAYFGLAFAVGAIRLADMRMLTSLILSRKAEPESTGG